MRSSLTKLLLILFVSLLFAHLPLPAAAAPIVLTIDSSNPGTNIDLTRYALGQGGLSDKPMFDSHIDQVAQLRPQTIRIFVQEFFNLYPKRGKYNWVTLDKVLETILATKAKPILCLCFKPQVLFPKIDQHLVHPTDYKEWEELIFQLVKHCNGDKKFGIEHWEIANEPDIGEDGGCPYLFQPADYVTYYSHTVQAIRRADPTSKVGGPALAGYNSDIGKALIDNCATGAAPLDFFSWHIYHSDPGYFRKSIREIKTRLAKFPTLQNTETIIDEWNMSLDQPVLEPDFQPAFILDTTLGFFEEGLSRSAYYHIRDFFVDEQQFSRFMSPKGTAFMARWWNEMPQYDGLYDNQGQVRPSYYTFKLLALLKGQQLTVVGTTSELKALAVKNDAGMQLVMWNFPASGHGDPEEVRLHFPANKTGRVRIIRLNATSHFNQLEQEQQADLAASDTKPITFTLYPYEIRWLTISP